MKKVIIVALLMLAGCSKKECMHIHMGAMLEICSENVRCITSKEGSDTLKMCEYIPPKKEENK